MGSAFSTASPRPAGDLSPVDGLEQDRVCLSSMPTLWLEALVAHHLSSTERLAVFRTCRGLAAVVTQHCTGLVLQPTATLQNNRRRACVLGLAAGCSNIHLRLNSSSLGAYSMVLDTQHVWPCITHLTLCDVHLTPVAIRSLHLDQLVQLHTLSLTSALQLPNRSSGFRHSDKLDVASLARITQAGGLPALSTLQCSCSSSDDAHITVSKLAPALGNHIAQLVVQGNSSKAVDTLGSWPAVLRAIIQRFNGGLQYAALATDAFPQLTHVTLPGTTCLGEGDEVAVSENRSDWEVLELVGLTSDSLLLSMPVQAARRLRVRGTLKVQGNPTQQRDTLEKLGQCEGVELVPVMWERNAKWGIDPRLPVFEIIGYPVPLPEALGWYLQRLQGTAIKLSAQGKITTSDAAVLAHITEHVRVLWLNEWQLTPACTWQQVLSSLPAHVTHVILGSCRISRDELLSAIELVTAPLGLKQLTLSYCAQRVDYNWVQLAANDAQAVQQAVATHWPGVNVEVRSY